MSSSVAKNVRSRSLRFEGGVDRMCVACKDDKMCATCEERKKNLDIVRDMMLNAPRMSEADLKKENDEWDAMMKTIRMKQSGVEDDDSDSDCDWLFA